MSDARFAIVPADAVTDTDLTATQLRVLLVIGTYLSKDDKAFPKQKTIADRLGIARETVNRAVKVLSDREYIQVHHQKRDDGGQRANQYTVKLDPCDRSVTPPVTSENHTPCDHTGSHPRTPQENATERKGKRATRLEKTWLPDDSLKTYALEKGVHETRLDDCIEDFVDYWTSDDASPKKDWPATWRGHCRRKFKQFSRPKAQEAYHGSRPQYRSQPGSASGHHSAQSSREPRKESLAATGLRRIRERQNGLFEVG